ncbi:MAG: DNA polymerase IV [Ignavibacteria bacterium]|nr:MAG: DNA polymerase IV [Ignavibacteria bacterium]KAF0162471.1 MAG: DNA polymerase IV [Ignavibacteria bacterium]
MKTIFHLDLDAFFVSVERLFDPSLIGKPVILGGDPKKGRGIVTTCSYEARAYGLYSSMPIKTAYRLCPNGIYVRGRHKEYSKYSKAVREILEAYAPVIQQCSIDEFSMDFTGCERIYGSLFMFASKIQKEIIDKLGLPCSIGIGSNKTIAKIASDFNKPCGVTYVIPGMEKDFLAPMPVETIPGIGKVAKKMLNSKGFYKLEQISSLSPETLRRIFGKYGDYLWRKSHGLGSDEFHFDYLRKSISHETTFHHEGADTEYFERILFELAQDVCQQLRNKNWLASTVTVKIRNTRFCTITRDKKITPTDDDQLVFQTVINLFRKSYIPETELRLLGVKLSKFNYLTEQEDLFDNFPRKEMFKAVKRIRDKFGYKSIRVGFC